MTKIKNVRPGILIIADAGLKLAPGQSRDIDDLTPQMKQALDDGLLAQMDSGETKPKAKAANRASESKESEKPKTAVAEAGQTLVSTSDPEKAAGQSESGKGRDAKPRQVVEAESGNQ